MKHRVSGGQLQECSGDNRHLILLCRPNRNSLISQELWDVACSFKPHNFPQAVLRQMSPTPVLSFNFEGHLKRKITSLHAKSKFRNISSNNLAHKLSWTPPLGAPAHQLPHPSRESLGRTLRWGRGTEGKRALTSKETRMELADVLNPISQLKGVPDRMLE